MSGETRDSLLHCCPSVCRLGGHYLNIIARTILHATDRLESRKGHGVLFSWVGLMQLDGYPRSTSFRAQHGVAQLPSQFHAHLHVGTRGEKSKHAIFSATEWQAQSQLGRRRWQEPSPGGTAVTAEGLARQRNKVRDGDINSGAIAVTSARVGQHRATEPFWHKHGVQWEEKKVTMRPACKVREMLLGEMIKTFKKVLMSSGIDARHAVSPSKHSIATEEEGHKEDIRTLRLAHNGGRLKERVRE
eukprot:scaffold100696_cov31-Tisochrysis_lutea.AAC.1